MPNDQYQVIAQMPRTKYDPVTRTNVEGFDVTYRDFKTNTRDVIFVSNEQHSPEQVNALIMAKLARIRGVAEL